VDAYGDIGEVGPCKYYRFDRAKQRTNTGGSQAFDPRRPMFPDLKEDARAGKRNDLEDDLAGWAQFRQPARRVDSVCKSLTLLVVYGY